MAIEVELNVGGKEHLEALEHLFQLFAEFDDILSFLHLDRQEQARVTVVPHHERRVLIPALYVGEILDVYRVAVPGNVDEHVPYFVFGVENSGGPDRNLGAGRRRNFPRSG